MRPELDSAVRFGLWLTYGNNTVEKWDSRRSASVPSGGIQRRMLSRKLRDLRRNWRFNRIALTQLGLCQEHNGDPMRITLKYWQAQMTTAQ